jgi:hypothetical protein
VWLAIAVAVCVTALASPNVVRQAPLGGLPPVGCSLGADSQPQPGVPKGTLTRVGDSLKSVTSPAADRDGNVFFADPGSSRIYRSDAARNLRLYKEGTGGARALRVGADGRLYASQLSARRLVSYGPSGDEKIVAQNIKANDGPGRSWLYVTGL